MLYVVNFLFFAIIYVACFFNKWKQQGMRRFSLQTLMYVYIVLVIKVTLMPIELIDFIPDSNKLLLQSINVIPYRDILAGYDGAVRETILNIIMLMPFGFLLPLINKTNIFKVLLWSLLVSLSIELFQLYFTWVGGTVFRSFDVTDLINNSLGGVLGYIISRSISFLVRKL